MTYEDARNLMQDYMLPPKSLLDELNPKDIRFIISFPRSGSRWLKWIIQLLIHEEVLPPLGGGYEEVAAALIDLGEIQMIPSLDRLAELPNSPGWHGVMRSHHTQEIFRRGFKVVYTFRWPPAVLHSYYHFALARKHIPPNTKIEDFLYNRVGVWEAHTLTALEAYEANPDQIQFVEYQPVGGAFQAYQIQHTMRHLGYNPSAKSVQDACALFTEHLRTIEELGIAPHKRGNNLTALEELTPEQMALFEHHGTDIYRRVQAIAFEQGTAATCPGATVPA